MILFYTYPSLEPLTVIEKFTHEFTERFQITNIIKKFLNGAFATGIKHYKEKQLAFYFKTIL